MDAKKILALSNQTLFELQEKSKQVNQTKDLTNKPPIIESKPDLNSLINKSNETDTNKNDVAVPADTSFKSSISDGPNDEKTNEQLALDKEPTSLSSSNSLFIFLGVLFAILIMLFVMKVKKQKEQKEIFSSINTDYSNLSNTSSQTETSSPKDEIALEEIEINLADKDQKPTHLD